MEINELIEKNESLEKELKKYRKKEEYTKIGLERTKSVYEIARKNAEIIILKSVNLAFEFKKDIEEVLLNIDRDPLEFKTHLDNFLKKNDHFLNNKNTEISNFIDDIINSLDKKFK